MQTIPISRLACALSSVVFTSDDVLAQTPGAHAGGPHRSWWGDNWYLMWPGPLLMVFLLALLIMILIRETAPRNRNVEPHRRKSSRSASPAAKLTRRNSKGGGE